MILNLSLMDTIFWVFAIGGSGIFFLRLLFNMLGIGDGNGLGGSETDHTFTVFSIHSLSGFFMMFGWGALAAFEQFGLSMALSSLIGLFSGLLMILATHFIFIQAKKLISEGDVFSIDDTIGKKGLVYQRIPVEGTGKIHVSVGQVTRELDAASADGKVIPSFIQVEIVELLDERTVGVKIFREQP